MMTDRDFHVLKAIAANGGDKKAVRTPYLCDVQVCVKGLIMNGYIKNVRRYSNLVIITKKGRAALDNGTKNITP